MYVYVYVVVDVCMYARMYFMQSCMHFMYVFYDVCMYARNSDLCVLQSERCCLGSWWMIEGS